jgi:glycosyltransferase involved in cell wall biosynthesis
MSSHHIGAATADRVHSPDIARLPLPRHRQQKIHVLTLAPFYPVEGDDGSGCFIAEPLRALNMAGLSHTVLLATPFYRATPPVHRVSLPATRLKYFSLPKGFGLASSGTFLFGRVLAFVKELKARTSIDLIHAHGALPCGHAASLLFRELGIPYVVSVHGLDAYSTNQVRGLSGRWCRRVSRMAYERARRVICVSERVKMEVDSHGSFSTQVIYNGVDPEIFHPAPESSPDYPLILSIGDLIPSKGHDTLLHAFAALSKKNQTIRCHIAGDGRERGNLSRLAAELGISDRVTFLGRISRQQVAEAMRRCTVFALPSSYEALGCVYLEAMECAKPVVACFGQGIEEIIRDGHNGLLIKPGNQQGLVEALSKLLGDSAFRRSLAANGHRTVHQNFTIAHQAENLARVYAESIR